MMTITIMVAAIYIVVTGGVVFGLSFLQAWLSKRESKWSGLGLPILSVVYAAAVSMMWSETGVLLMVFVFAICNIPTAIFLIIYKKYRNELLNKDEIDKMKIQDL